MSFSYGDGEDMSDFLIFLTECFFSHLVVGHKVQPARSLLVLLELLSFGLIVFFVLFLVEGMLVHFQYTRGWLRYLHSDTHHRGNVDGTI